MPARRVKEFLDSKGVKYVIIKHSLAYTSQEIAASAHIRGKEMAKTVMVKVDGALAMAVLPAARMVDIDRLQEALGATSVEIAGEEDFRGTFPECELGAMPPFGNLYDMAVYVSPELQEDEEIAFNAGTHTELFRLAYKDFERLVRPQVVPMTMP